MSAETKKYSVFFHYADGETFAADVELTEQEFVEVSGTLELLTATENIYTTQGLSPISPYSEPVFGGAGDAIPDFLLESLEGN
jgi:hypothetical protein